MLKEEIDCKALPRGGRWGNEFLLLSSTKMQNRNYYKKNISAPKAVFYL